jgi:methylaspartate ammonia-lyase
LNTSARANADMVNVKAPVKGTILKTAGILRECEAHSRAR